MNNMYIYIVWYSLKPNEGSINAVFDEHAHIILLLKTIQMKEMTHEEEVWRSVGKAMHAWWVEIELE